MIRVRRPPRGDGFMLGRAGRTKGCWRVTGHTFRTSAVVVALLLYGCVATAQAADVKAMWGPGIVDGTSRFPIYQDLGVKIYEDVVHGR
jgi:hypothetical protein